VAVAKSKSYWGRAAHRRAVVVGALIFAIIAGGGVAAWAATSGGPTGYRMGTVTRADIGTDLTVVGNVEPVSDAAPSFQVGGQVATVDVTPGQKVAAGQTLATLSTTALSETVSSAESTLSSDQAKLTEDERNQSSAAATSTSTSTGATHKSQPTTTTTVPSSGSGTSSAQDATVAQDQATLTQDEATLNADQQQEAADLAQAQSDCTSANTASPAGQATCVAALQTVSADEQQVSKDQSTVSKDEIALGQALGLPSSSGGSSSGSSGGTGSSGSTGSPGTGGAPGGSTPPQSKQSLEASPASATLISAVTSTVGSGGSGLGGAGGASSGDTDTPEQIASDQANIDTAEADLTLAQQSLQEATLTSPVSGTVVSVGIVVGDTISAGSSTDVITIIGTDSYEAQATLDSTQVPSIKVGQSAEVEVDGVNGTLAATVAQVGPVQSSTSGFSYPVVVALPVTNQVLHAGSAANVAISTGSVSHVIAVPTSAVQTVGSNSFVLELNKGVLTRQVIKIGMVGDEYTQVLSGLAPGTSVVLADYAEAVPSSSTNTNTGGLGNLLGGGGAGGGAFFFGGGGFPGGRGGFTISPG
jgi:HlyD family secretion protein